MIHEKISLIQENQYLFDLLESASKYENLALQNGLNQTFKYYYFCIKLIKIFILAEYDQEKYKFIELRNNY